MIADPTISTKQLSSHSFNNNCRAHRAVLYGLMRALWQVFGGAVQVLGESPFEAFLTLEAPCCLCSQNEPD
jgi:hypothetical protein